MPPLATSTSRAQPCGSWRPAGMSQSGPACRPCGGQVPFSHASPQLNLAMVEVAAGCGRAAGVVSPREPAEPAGCWTNGTTAAPIAARIATEPAPTRIRRSRARPREAWLFTAPTLQPSVAAVCASLRSAKYRSTSTARCRDGSSASARSSRSRSASAAAWSAVTLRRVHHDLAHIRLGHAGPGDPPPAPPGPLERVLQQVLGLGPAQPGQQQRRGEQPPRRAGHELLERGIARAAGLLRVQTSHTYLHDATRQKVARAGKIKIFSTERIAVHFSRPTQHFPGWRVIWVWHDEDSSPRQRRPTMSSPACSAPMACP